MQNYHYLCSRKGFITNDYDSSTTTKSSARFGRSYQAEQWSLTHTFSASQMRAVVKANQELLYFYWTLVKGEIAISRYESYLSLLGDCAENKYR